MRKSIEINGKLYKPAEMNFNNICRMEELGAPLTEGGKLDMVLVRGYVALCMNADVEVAGNEIEQHVVNGGNLRDAYDALNEAVEESDFFRKASQMATEETPKVEKKSKSAKE